MDKRLNKKTVGLWALRIIATIVVLVLMSFYAQRVALIAYRLFVLQDITNPQRAFWGIGINTAILFLWTIILARLVIGRKRQ